MLTYNGSGGAIIQFAFAHTIDSCICPCLVVCSVRVLLSVVTTFLCKVALLTTLVACVRPYPAFTIVHSSAFTIKGEDLSFLTRPLVVGIFPSWVSLLFPSLARICLTIATLLSVLVLITFLVKFPVLGRFSSRLLIILHLSAFFRPPRVLDCCLFIVPFDNAHGSLHAINIAARFSLAAVNVLDNV